MLSTLTTQYLMASRRWITNNERNTTINWPLRTSHKRFGDYTQSIARHAGILLRTKWANLEDICLQLYMHIVTTDDGPLFLISMESQVHKTGHNIQDFAGPKTEYHLDCILKALYAVRPEDTIISL